MGAQDRLSVSLTMETETDPTRVPGKPFLEYLYGVLNVCRDYEEFPTDPDAAMTRPRRASTRQLLINQHEATTKHDLIINAPCLCYLQKLFLAMLTPTKSEYSGMITQWRLNPTFARQLEENPKSTANLGTASPQRILQLAGWLLEVKTLFLEGSPVEAHVTIPSDCNLIMFPKLDRLCLDGVDLEMIHGFDSVADTLMELRFKNGTLSSVDSLLSHRVDATVYKWRNLRKLCLDSVQLTQTELTVTDLAPNLESVRFRKTGLDSFGSLVGWAWLSTLDLSHNFFHTVSIPVGVFEHLKALNLSHNRISSIQGLCGCMSLVSVDLSHNLILTLATIQELAVLPHLRSVELNGNPVAKHHAYRQNARSLLPDAVILDQVPWTREDSVNLIPGSSSIRRREVTVTEVNHTNNAKKQQSTVRRVDPWTVGRGILRSCIAIGLAHVVVSTVWSRDATAEQLTWSIVVATAVLGVISVTLALAVSWVFRICRRKLIIARCQDEQTDNNTRKGQMTTVRKITRGLSAKLTIEEHQLLVNDADSALRIQSLSDSLQTAVREGDDLSIQHFVDVCSQLKTILAFWSGPAGNGIGFAWQRLNRAMINFSRERNEGELVRDRLNSSMSVALDAAEPSTSFSTSLRKTLPVLRLCAIMLSSVTLESDASQVLRDAYIQVFASDHQWWRQRVILSGIANVPLTTTFFEWLNPSSDLNRRHLVEDIHKCGERLHFLHVSIQEIVDEHMHSFAHHYPPM